MSDTEKTEQAKTAEELEIPKDVYEDLANVMEQQADVEYEISKFSHEKLKDVFAKRRELVKKIPTFWFTVLQTSPDLAEFITVEDAELLDNLSDLHVEWDKENHRNFSITFSFRENGFLEDSSLTLKKDFECKDLGQGQYKYVSKPTEIKWKKGMDLTKNKDGEAASDYDTFFNFFSFTGEGPGDFQQGENMALTITEELYPHALKFFVEANTMSDDDDIEGEYEIEEDDDEDDVEEEEEDGKEAPPKKKAKTEEEK